MYFQLKNLSDFVIIGQFQTGSPHLNEPAPPSPVAKRHDSFLDDSRISGVLMKAAKHH